ncbi:MAG TPA: NUDIX hydrolase, partial [Mycobacterium sp.]
MSLHASAVEMLTAWQAPDSAQDTLRHAVLAFLAARTDGCLRSC